MSSILYLSEMARGNKKTPSGLGLQAGMSIFQFELRGLGSIRGSSRQSVERRRSRIGARGKSKEGGSLDGARKSGFPLGRGAFYISAE